MSRRHEFNQGRSSVEMQWSNINHAWFVYRQDGEHQGNLSIHNEIDDAMADFDRRVAFIEEMESDPPYR